MTEEYYCQQREALVEQHNKSMCAKEKKAILDIASHLDKLWWRTLDNFGTKPKRNVALTKAEKFDQGNSRRAAILAQRARS